MKRIVKIGILLFISLFISGCTATYNLKINEDGTINDSLVVNHKFSAATINLYTKNKIPTSLDENCVLDYDTYDGSANEEYDENSNYYTVSYKNNMLSFQSQELIDNYDNTRIANLLFNNIHVNNYSNMISVYGYNGLAAFLSYRDLDSVVVNIEVSGNVVENNADKVVGNKYTWYFNKNTADSKELYIEMDSASKEKTVVSKKSKINTSYILIGLFAILIILLIALKISQSKKQKM